MRVQVIVETKDFGAVVGKIIDLSEEEVKKTEQIMELVADGKVSSFHLEREAGVKTYFPSNLLQNSLITVIYLDIREKYALLEEAKTWKSAGELKDQWVIHESRDYEPASCNRCRTIGNRNEDKLCFVCWEKLQKALSLEND